MRRSAVHSSFSATSRWRIVTIPGAIALIAAVVAGCSGAGSSNSAAAIGTVQKHSAAPSPSASTAAPLDAQALNGLLLPKKDMPTGYTAPKGGMVYDGKALPDDAPSPMPTSQLCSALADTGAIRVSGIDAADFAQAAYVSSSQTDGIYEEIDAFTSADARTAMSRMWTVLGQCKTFIEHYNGVNASVTLTRSKLTGAWDGFKALQLAPQFRGGSTLAAIRVGYAVVTVYETSSGSDDGAAAVTMAQRIASRLSAAEKR